MPINPDEDKHASGLYRAMALRMYCRYLDLRDTAKFYGEDLADHGRLPSQLEAFENYERALDEWLLEPPASPSAVMAIIEFAGLLAADKLLGDVIRKPVGDQDAYHQILVLTSAGDWLNQVNIQHWFDRRAEAAKGGDAELLAAERELAEVRRKYDAKRPLSDAAVEQKGDEVDPIEKRIYETPPDTTAGALVKLRHFINSGAARGDHGVSDGERTLLHQIAEFLERETQPNC